MLDMYHVVSMVKLVPKYVTTTTNNSMGISCHYVSYSVQRNPTDSYQLVMQCAWYIYMHGVHVRKFSTKLWLDHFD